MKIRNVITIAANERGILLVDARPARFLEPGRHVVWSFKSIDVVRLPVAALVVELTAEQLAVVPAGVIRSIEVFEGERALIRRRGRPVRWLVPGTYGVWNVERVERLIDGERVLGPAVDVEIVAVDGLATKPLADDVRALVPASEYVETTVPVGAVGLRFVDGVLDAELPPGRYGAWTVRQKVVCSVLDLRERQIAVNGQDVMTRDKVTLRLNVTATVKIVDARRVASIARDADAAVHLAVQLVLRDAVGARALDEILADRDVLVRVGGEALTARVATLGLALVELGIKDVILPGEMRTLLNRVIEAQKEAEANVILRREETAATRSLAQTAKVLADNPLLVRLKELEAYKELAAKVGTVNLVLGSEALTKLELKT